MRAAVLSSRWLTHQAARENLQLLPSSSHENGGALALTCFIVIRISRQFHPITSTEAIILTIISRQSIPGITQIPLLHLLLICRSHMPRVNFWLILKQQTPRHSRHPYQAAWKPVRHWCSHLTDFGHPIIIHRAIFLRITPYLHTSRIRNTNMDSFMLRQVRIIYKLFYYRFSSVL